MANKKNKKKYSNAKKHYLVTIGVIIFVILISIYSYMWYRVYEQEKYLTSYLISSNTISLEMNEINEIDAVLSETPSYYFVYLGYTKDKKVYELEKDLKPLIDKYSLHNNFYYLNVTDLKDEKNYLTKIAEKLNIPQDKLPKVPIILYFKDNTLVTDGVTTAKDFKELLEKYNEAM